MKGPIGKSCWCGLLGSSLYQNSNLAQTGKDAMSGSEKQAVTFKLEHLCRVECNVRFYHPITLAVKIITILLEVCFTAKCNNVAGEIFLR